MEPITWQTAEYAHKDRSVDWFWAIGLISIAGCVAAILFKNYLFGILILLSGVCLALLAKTKPNMVDIALSEESITIAGDVYPFKKILEFNIVREKNTDVLLILTDRKVFPLLHVDLDPQTRNDVEIEIAKHVKRNDELFMSHDNKILEAIGF